jgi:hypothetical protein
MMARAQVRRSGTLIDPESLQRPISRHQDSLGARPALGRRNSANIRPLLDFDDNQPGNKTTLPPNPRARSGRSVFGTDTLWEREMVKLKEIEAQEQLEKEEREGRDAEEAARLDKKKKKSKKSKGKSIAPVVEQSDIPREFENAADPVPRVSATPPLLPAIQKATVRGPPPVNDDDNESESDNSAQHAPHDVRHIAAVQRQQQIVGSQDHQMKTKERHVGLQVSGLGIKARAIMSPSLQTTTVKKICLSQRLLGVPYSELCPLVATTRTRMYHCLLCLTKLK